MNRPAFIIENWGEGNVALKINGKKIARGGDFRYGHRKKPEGTDLIVWIRKESTEPVKITLAAAK